MAPDIKYLHPLSEFYVRSGQPLPAVKPIEEKNIPEPYKGLLKHDAVMSHRLGEYCGQAVHLQVINTHLDDEAYMRQFAMKAEDQTPLQFGANKIYLNKLPEEAQRLVLEGQMLFSKILQQFNISFITQPQVFFQVTADDTMKELANRSIPDILYGRRHVFMSADKGKLNESVAILFPANQPVEGTR